MLGYERMGSIVLQQVPLVMVTSRQPYDRLFYELKELVDWEEDNPIKSVTRIGDCEAPAIIAGAVFSGHRYARELEEKINEDSRIKYDRVFFTEWH